ncbi:undecaprenyldiphospho-muramoylpentapeptide beta-N-acetylglucosaminyltransferase [Tepidanaerobacter syntrophicus]|uniref:UDP-N-acetylglucosamine--N-acetylmuramyl-(pentapeptide) pyrophosphoryl-undecaprenol N-acetylglucosamine transferase n=1 Tax=Tepidanaerobacter syntrophicus TaxID=224999 RepID=A0A0U9HHA7_9FIRM|nr:undecaprenyldiphospho-muramoylpentapeptide beta-N-acetylglucosaminyltransferase [Tepidanaerobacter syntrophicus]GAQ25499.1 UDP-N-acetylglucosamine--N-acetylmuramyl-(pentapeptide) pyrophosphoryl-undecaprenol N-acetylglucosamine transferase [Tepidanaerobacter syntrophicus]GLI18546.1 UDP-N-acetylglucosamine--N-acetylmuramyl-(pentapeptide) pyrophosphoryl-undecaprenol N-acetylglucosamine transferase [Tepidanaerobacter syntrophicus]
MPPEKNKKFIFAGGGTGGHIYPAIAIASGLKRKYPDSDILFIGTGKQLEKDIVEEAGFPLKIIHAKGFERKLSIDTLRSLHQLILGAADSIKILKEEKPDLVIGTGGYTAGPVVFFASLMGIPCAIHEQNVIPGVTNKILSQFAKKIFISFPESANYFPKNKVILAGNPVRPEITKGTRREALEKFGLSPNMPTVLSFGGSQGAMSLNNAIYYVIKTLIKSKEFQLIHVTGKNNYSKIMQSLMDDKIDLGSASHIVIKPYINDMENAYAAADLIISRAGALTIAELSACGKPAILIPLPSAANRHQDFNAALMEKNGAAIVIYEKDLTGEKLYKSICNIIFDKECLLKMSASSKKLARNNALDTILQEIEKLLK